MNRLFLLIFMTIITTTVSFSQEKTSLTVVESKEYKDEIKTEEILSIHTTRNGLTGVVRKGKKNIQLDVFDTMFKKVFSKVVEHDKKETFVGEVFNKDEIKFFTVLSPKKTERILYCHIFNLNDQTHKKKLLFKTTVEKKRSLFYVSNKRETSFAISPDGNYFTINTDNYKRNINSYTIRVFDSHTLEVVYKKSYQTFENKYFEPNDIIIKNNQTVYTLGKSFLTGKSQKRNKEVNYQFILNKISKEKTESLNITLDNELIQSLVFSEIDDKLHILGFYAEKNIGGIKGGCDFIVNQTNFSLVGRKKYGLPKNIYDDIYNTKASERKKKKKKELANYTIDHVLYDGKGNTFLIAEEFYITQMYVSNGQFGGSWITVFHYDNILVLKFNKDGNLSWGRSIFKKETFPSYNAFIKNGKLQIILNSGKSLSQKSDGRTKISKGLFESSALYNIVFGEEGEITYEKIRNNKDKSYYLPYYGTYENDSFIMPNNNRKKRRFMILK